MQRSTRRAALTGASALFAGAAVVAAAAATLGGLDVEKLGAQDAPVVSCETDGVTVEFDTGYHAAHGYEVTGVLLDGISTACMGQEVFVTLSGVGGVPLWEGSEPLAVDQTTASFVIGDHVGAAEVAGVSVMLTAAEQGA